MSHAQRPFGPEFNALRQVSGTGSGGPHSLDIGADRLRAPQRIRFRKQPLDPFSGETLQSLALLLRRLLPGAAVLLDQLGASLVPPVVAESEAFAILELGRKDDADGRLGEVLF